MSDTSTSNLNSPDIAISVSNVSKAYRIWRDPSARLKAPLWDTVGTLIPKKLRPKALQERLAHQTHSRYYKDFYALKDVSFEVKKGEAMGIIGRNGSGKSTLLQMIAGTLTPTEGRIQVNGRVAALLELGSGFNPDFTGRENVYLNASVLGLTRDQIDARYENIVAFAEIGDFINQPVKTYSSGMVVRLAFAVQVQIEPDILIVDEALSVGDAFFQHRCLRKMEELMGKGMTLLFVSHDSAMVRKVCPHCLLLNKGLPVALGLSSKIISEYTYLLDQQIVEDKKSDPPRFQGNLSISNENTLFIPAVLHIPNIDHRLGDGSAKIIGIGIYDARGLLTQNIDSGSAFEIRVTFKTEEQIALPLIGVTIYDPLRNEITATNTEYENHLLPPLHVNSQVTVSFKFTPPQLAPGIYSIDAAVNNGTQNNHSLCDWVVNAAAIEISCRDRIHGRIRIATTVAHFIESN